MHHRTEHPATALLALLTARTVLPAQLVSNVEYMRSALIA